MMSVMTLYPNLTLLEKLQSLHPNLYRETEIGLASFTRLERNSEVVFKFSSIRIGAFGEVYICIHRQAGFTRAVKVLQKSAIDESDRERFLCEINILKIMDHPNIVRLYETYSDNKRYYLVTEYLIKCY